MSSNGKPRDNTEFDKLIRKSWPYGGKSKQSTFGLEIVVRVPPTQR